MATLVDVLGGILSVRALHPDWMATASLSMHTSGSVEKGWISATGRVIRTGRTMTVIQVDIYGQENAAETEQVQAGTALMTFSRLPVKGKTVLNEPQSYTDQTVDFGLPGSGFDRPILEKAGVRIVDEQRGIVTMDLTPYVRNSIHCLQGGMVATLAEVAGQRAAGTSLGEPVHTRDLVLHYLALGRVGPIETRTQVIRHDRCGVLTRVEIALLPLTR